MAIIFDCVWVCLKKEVCLTPRAIFMENMRKHGISSAPHAPGNLSQWCMPRLSVIREAMALIVELKTKDDEFEGCWAILG